MSESEARARKLINDPARTKPEFIGEPNMDKVVTVLMRLAMEITVLRDRLDTHEALAEQSGGYSEADVDAYEADPERAKRRMARKMALIESITHDLM